MRKFIRFLVYILAILILLLILAGILLVTVVNPNNFKNQITQLVYSKTHRNLTINGNISWSFYPWIGLKANDVSLSNPPNFDATKTMAHIDNADVSVRLMPLLHKQIEVDHLTLNGLTLNLVKNKEGRGNWENFTISEKPATQSNSATETSKPLSFTASSVNVTHSNVNYTDEQTGLVKQIRELQFKTSQLNVSNAFPVHLQFEWQSNQPAMSGNVTLSSKVTLYLNEQKYIFNNTHLRATTWKQETPDQKIETHFEGDIFADLKQKSVALTHLKASLDDSHFTGYINVSNFETLSANFDLAVDHINLDKYMPGKAATAPVSPGIAATQPTSAAAKTYDNLRKLNLDGLLRAGSLTVSNMNLTNLVARISAHNGIIQISPINANIYQGSANGQFSMNVTGAVPSYSINETLTNIQLSEFTKSNKLTGIANISANLNMTGADSAALKSSLAGNAKFSINNAVLQGVDIPFQLRRANALLKKLPEPTDNSKKTDLGSISGSGTFSKGVFTNKDLLMESPVVRITGQGTADLNTETLNYRLLANEMHNGVASQLQIPLIVTGPFKDPTITPDLQSLLKGELSKRIEQLMETRKQRQEQLRRGIRRSILIQRILNH